MTQQNPMDPSELTLSSTALSTPDACDARLHTGSQCALPFYACALMICIDCIDDMLLVLHMRSGVAGGCSGPIGQTAGAGFAARGR